jgi:hypothetical protein
MREVFLGAPTSRVRVRVCVMIQTNLDTQIEKKKPEKKSDASDLSCLNDLQNVECVFSQ